MQGRVSHELEVKQPASKVWEIYGSLKLGKLIMQKLPHMIEKIDIDGDGGAGTVLTVTFPKGTRAFSSFKEKFAVIDNEKRVKVAEVVEGGYLDVGFASHRTTLEIAEKEGGSSSTCIIRSAIEYEIHDEETSKCSPVTIAGLEMVANMVADHLAEIDDGKKNMGSGSDA